MTLQKPRLSFFQIFYLSFGFLGIQLGFALQNANASRILQTFGADVHSLSWFWIIPPLMGLIVQPIIGHYSDKTWTRMGRRKPYFLLGSHIVSFGAYLDASSGHICFYIAGIVGGSRISNDYGCVLQYRHGAI
jgi:maltose/moltooligosaccharide transporter